MKNRKPQTGRFDSGVNLTPLVDVVMVILIFMMLAGTFHAGEHFLPANYAAGRESSGIPLDIRVEQGVDGRMVARFGDFQTSDAAQLTERLALLGRQLDSVGRTLDSVPVQISPGKRVPYRLLVDVYDAALKANFTRVAFARSR